MNPLRDIPVGINGVAMLSPLTGLGQYTFHLVHELQKLHLRPWLFYGADWRQEVRAATVPGIGIAKKVFKRFMPRPYVALRYLLQRRFSSGVRQHGIKLYHETNFMAYRFQGPTVVTVHDLSWIRYPETHPVERVREMNRLMPQTIQRAAHILVDSEFVRREVIDYYGLPQDRVTTVLLGATSNFKPSDAGQCAAVFDQYGLRFGEYILAVATLEPRKNLATVIASFSQLPTSMRRRFPLVIVGMRGWGTDRLSDGLRQLIERGEAHLTGYVAQANLPALYAGARLFVYPSLYEGFGLPPLEAMASGVPVIVSNRASLPEVVGEAAILVEPFDDVDISQKMRSLIEDDALHSKFSVAGHQRAREFTWNRCALKTLAVYKEVMAKI